MDDLDRRCDEAGGPIARRLPDHRDLSPPSPPSKSGAGAARLLADAGAAIALATGFNPDQPGTLSMQTAIALAHLRMGLSVNEAVSAATINGAHALGCADRLGSLEPGKSADLLILDTPDYRELGRHVGDNAVHLAMKHGKPIYRLSEIAPKGGRPRL